MRTVREHAMTSVLRVPLAALVVCVVALGTVSAQDAPDASAGSAGRAVSGSVGLDVGSDYYFRGIIQETEGFIAQPYFETSLTLYQADSGLQSVSLTSGTWSSLHSGPSGADGAAGTPKMWYESDFYASLGLGFADAWSTDITYTAYMSPNQSFGTVKELALGVAYDGLLSPSATLAVELDGQADGGANEGTYLELGIEHGLSFPNSSVSMAFPASVGLSLKDYYEASTGATFGFFNVGAILSLPLSVPAQYGAWEFSGGVNLLVFGDALQDINGSTDSVTPVGVFGISFGY